MNNTTKFQFVILIFIFSTSLFSQDLIITIPEQYSNKELALPPFPEEVINELPEIYYEGNLLISDSVRTIPLIEVTYNYYPEFLNFKISEKDILIHGITIDGSSDSLKALYSIEKDTNNYFLKVGGGYNSDVDLVDGLFSYSDYRLPFDFNLKGSIEDEMVLAEAGNINYFSIWSLTGGIENGSGIVEGLYKNNYYLRPLISAGYIDSEEYYIESALGWDFFRFGFSYLSSSIYPYFELSRKLGNSRIIAQTDTDFSTVEYLLYYQFPKGVPLDAGGGVTITDNYSSVVPGLYINESFFLGNRVYNISTEDLTFEISFNKDSISSIITFNYPYESGEWSLGINLEYKAGE